MMDNEILEMQVQYFQTIYIFLPPPYQTATSNNGFCITCPAAFRHWLTVT